MRTRIVETFKSLLMTVLFALMLMLLVIYATQMRLIRGENDELPAAVLYGADSGTAADSERSLELSRVLPEFVGYKSSDDSEPRGIYLNETTLDYIFSSMTPYIRSLFSAAELCVYEPENTLGERLWEEALESERYVYIKFPSQLPYTVINVAVGGEEKLGGTLAYVRELFIIVGEPEEDTAEASYLRRSRYYGVARDENGAVISFVFPEDGDSAVYYFDIIDMTAYDANRDFVSFDFYANLLYSGELTGVVPLEDTAVVTSANIASSRISVNRVLEPEFTGTDEFKELLRALGYSGRASGGENSYADGKYSSYTETDSDGGTTEVYVNQSGFLRVSTEKGLISYEATAKTAGVELASNSGENGAGLERLLSAAEKLIRSFADCGSGFSGGDARLGLIGVWSENSEIIIEYGYYYSGAYIADSAGRQLTAYRFGFYGGRLVSLSAQSIDTESADVSSVSYSTKWLTLRLDEISGKRIFVGIPEYSAGSGRMLGCFRPAYCIPDGAPIVTCCDWVFYIRADLS